MAQKVDYEQGIDDIKSTIHLKGINLAEHSLQYNTLIRKFSEPHLREGMVSTPIHHPYILTLPVSIDCVGPLLLISRLGRHWLCLRTRPPNQGHHD